MRLIALEILAVVAVLVFLTTMVVTVMHRSARASEDSYQTSPLAEYLWAVVPWLIVAACVFPAVRQIIAEG
jgi:heme/copper-type cytochrome/quinol oxidase subunit 2